MRLPKSGDYHLKHDDELLSREEVSDWLGVCVHTIMRNPNFKPLRFSARLLRYRVGDVRKVIQSATKAKV